MDKKVTDTYRMQKIMSASPAEMVVMLYDESIGALSNTIKAIEENDTQARWKANNKAQRILQHMSDTLDMEQGGEVAANLSRLYDFILRELLWVDLENDAQRAANAIRLLKPLRDSWRTLAVEQKPARRNQPVRSDGSQPIGISA